MSKYTPFAFLVLIILLGFSACQKDNTFTGTTPMLKTSLDTMTFDTVFTTVGSATRSFKIYNIEQEDIYVSVALKNQNSKFRLNVDGTAGNSINEVFIAGGDSVYVFADVTVDPDQPLSISPFVIEEYLTITASNTTKEILLVAWGQNANYVPQSKRTGSISLLSCDLESETWDDPKPYVIYGVLLVDSCDLIIPEGTDIYVHGGLVRADEQLYNEGFLIVLKDGKIIANGSNEHPITFQGDRLEGSFDDVAGQWVGIRLFSGSQGNIFNHVMIKNSIVGIRVDSAAQLTMNACEIHNTSSIGLLGIRSTITATNTLIYNTGQQSAVLTYWG